MWISEFPVWISPENQGDHRVVIQANTLRTKNNHPTNLPAHRSLAMAGAWKQRSMVQCNMTPTLQNSYQHVHQK